MNKIVYCKDCKYSTCWHSESEARRLGVSRGRECSRNIINCPSDFDFCSYGEMQLKCPKCGTYYDTFPNYCSKCGQQLLVTNQTSDASDILTI